LALGEGAHPDQGQPLTHISLGTTRQALSVLGNPGMRQGTLLAPLRGEGL
jgi:hypothetical protein